MKNIQKIYQVVIQLYISHLHFIDDRPDTSHANDAKNKDRKIFVVQKGTRKSCFFSLSPSFCSQVEKEAIKWDANISKFICKFFCLHRHRKIEI